MAKSRYKPGEIIVHTEVEYIARAMSDKEYYFMVRHKGTGRTLHDGWIGSLDGAKRCTRNYIKNNQDAVYG